MTTIRTSYSISLQRQLQCAKQCLRVYYHPDDFLITSHSDVEGCYHIVALEGTDSFSNWIHNIMILKRKGVHIGFRKYATYFKKQHRIRKKISALYTPAPVYFTGHSLGAAASTLLSYDFANDYNVANVVFGSPNIGDEHFNKQYREKKIATRSYKNCNDIVSRIPFEFMGYNSMDRIVLTPTIPSSDIMKNHSILTYIKELTSLAYPEYEDYIL